MKGQKHVLYIQHHTLQYVGALQDCRNFQILEQGPSFKDQIGKDGDCSINN
jgi:hypothetical protein